MLSGKSKELADMLRNRLSKGYEFCALMDKAGITKTLKFSMEEQCRRDIIFISLYFAMADGSVREEEAELLNYVLGFNYSAQKYEEIYNSCEYLNDSFENRKVLSLEVTKIFDSVVKEVKSTELFINLFCDAAKAIIVIDGDISEDEIATIAAYRANLESKYL